MTTPRIINIVLGVWLFLSAFLWPHSGAQFNNAWICGVLVVATAVMAATRWPEVRYANAVIGAWLFISSFFLPRQNEGTLWNHLLVGIALFAVSFLPGELVPRRARPTGPAPVAR